MPKFDPDVLPGADPSAMGVIPEKQVGEGTRQTKYSLALGQGTSGSALEKLLHHFGGRCDDRRSEVETLQFDREAGEIHPSQMLVTRQKQSRSEQRRFSHQLRVVHF